MLPMINRHSLSAHTAYLDLLRSLKDETVMELRGKPEKSKRNGRTYWYDVYRVGNEVKRNYIGEDTPEQAARMANIEALRQQAAERRKNRTHLVRVLREEGLISTDGATGSLLAALANAGVFRLGGTLVGTQAFRLYEGELGVKLARDQMAMTNDIDIASFERLSLALNDVVDPQINEVLSDFSFAPVPGQDAEKVWRWRQSGRESTVEFLTPSFEEEEGLKRLEALGVDAQALHHLNFVLSQPINAAALYRSGVLVQIPRPERYAIHKLIVADRRRNELKSRKDLMQAEKLIEILVEDRPDEIADAYHKAMTSGTKWQKRIQNSLSKLPKTKIRLESFN